MEILTRTELEVVFINELGISDIKFKVKIEKFRKAKWIEPGGHKDV